MVKFTIDQVSNIMNHQKNIRNMSVIAHVDHGKITLSDALICKARLIAQSAAGKARWTDGRKDQIYRGITIKSTGVSMHYKYDVTNSGDPNEEQEYLINLIDSPGHVDFSSQVTAALRVTDGALVVVDAAQGVCAQTQTVLRQAMQERIKPVLMVNKLDRSIVELMLEPQQIYQQLNKIIDKVNITIVTYQKQVMGQIICDPSIGNVAFGSGKGQWGFTLQTFARIYAKEYGLSEQQMMKKLWGDNYYDNVTKKWTNNPQSENGVKLKRAFVQFIMEPIKNFYDTLLSQNRQKSEILIEKLKINLNNEQKGLLNKQLLKIAMIRWLPAANCLLQMMIQHLPSPDVAQKYRAEYLYQGSLEDECYQAMKNCDPKGPVMIYISKMVPEGGRFYAFGRIFSGTIYPGQKVKILGANYKPGSKNDMFEKSIQRVGVAMGINFQVVAQVPCGNTLAVSGIDEYLVKTGTLISVEVQNPSPIRSMKYSVSPIFRVAVKPKNPADLQKLVGGIKRLSKSDPLVQCIIQQTGEIIVAGCGQLHVEICLNDLKEFSKCEIIESKPTVSYQQTITKESSEAVLSKTGNKHNRFFGTSIPLDQNLIKQIEKGEINMKADHKERNKRLVEEFQWEKSDAVKVWSFGPDEVGANILVDKTTETQGMHDIADSMITAFQQATKNGVLAEQPMRGSRFNITQAVIHLDPAHRKQFQVIPAGRRLYYGLELVSQPTLLQPIFNCQITVPQEATGGVFQTLNARRGNILQENEVEGTPLKLIRAQLPVAQSFGFIETLRGNTHGKAFPQCFFDHWQPIKGNVFQDKLAKQIVLEIRKRKGLKQQLPMAKDYMDKI